MSKNTINELNNALFETLRGLQEGTIDLDRAKAINETAQTIINGAKVQVECIRVAGGGSSSFLGVANDGTPEIPKKPALSDESKTVATQHGSKTVTQITGGTVTRHVMRR